MRATADQWIRRTTVLAVVTVSGIAAVVSYSHIQHVSITHGQTRLDAALMPVSVDGLILAASMTAFYASRNRLPVPFLARFALALGIGATIAANCLFGISHGWLGAVLSAWPAVAFIFAMELVIWTVRVAAGKPGRARRTPSVARSWARDNGYDVAERGRLSGEALAAYEASNAETVTTPNGHGPTDILLVGSESG
jgi:Protein of unknown function (DUF2637)